ncbi:hypothetical protein [Alkalihalobacillus sp. BA299]|nr:hypothetical protein [Alkalihalobacillus sp. BA299]
MKTKYNYEYPDAKGEVICSYCDFKTDLPVNFCCGLVVEKN